MQSWDTSMNKQSSGMTQFHLSDFCVIPEGCLSTIMPFHNKLSSYVCTKCTQVIWVSSDASIPILVSVSGQYYSIGYGIGKSLKYQ